MDGLSSEQVKELAQYLLDQYGPDLTDQGLTDCVLLVLEDIAGYELADEEAMQLILNQIREHYYDLINESN
jgi:hypothetical protein